MKLNEKASVNNKLDRYTKNWSIQIYGNEHGEGHMEVNIGGMKYYVLIPTVEQWYINKTFIPYITITKTNTIPKKYISELVSWADELSKYENVYYYTNLEYCRASWNMRNYGNIHKTLVFFDKIKDISSSLSPNKNILNIGNIEVEVIKEGNKYLKFIYNNSTYEYNYGYISHLEGDMDETEFLQNIFENNY